MYPCTVVQSTIQVAMFWQEAILAVHSNIKRREGLNKALEKATLVFNIAFKVMHFPVHTAVSLPGKCTS